MSALHRISKSRGVPVAVIMSNPQNGKGYDAQCEYIHTLCERGLDTEDIGLFFGQSDDWVRRRLRRAGDIGIPFATKTKE